MRRSSEYNDVLLKAFIRESFIQCKREDLFERKNNLISENKKRLIKEQKVFNEVLMLIENFENSIDNIILESSSRYSIKDILLEKKYYPNPERKELSFLTDMYKNEDPLSFDFTQETKKLEKMWNQHVEEYKKDKIDPYIMPGTTTKLDPEAAKEYFIHSHREKPEGRTVMQWMRDNKTLIYRLLFLPMCLSKLGVHQGNLMHKLGGGEKLDPEVIKLLEPVMKTAPGGKVEIDKAELKKVTGANDQEVEKVVKEIEETSDKIQEKAKEEPKAKKSVVDKIKQKAKKVVKKVKEKIKKVEQQSEPETQQQSEPETQQQSEPEAQKDEFENPSKEEIEKSIQDDLKGKKDGAASRFSVSEDAKTNEETFKANQKTAKSNEKLGKRQTEEGKNEASKNSESVDNIDLSEFDYNDKTIDDIGKAIGSAIEGLGHGEVESKYQSDFDDVKDFRARTSGQDRLGDASNTPGQDTSSGKVHASKGMKQLNTLSAMKDEIKFQVAKAMKNKDGTPRTTDGSTINFDKIIKGVLNNPSVKLDPDVKTAIENSIENGKISPNAIAYGHLQQSEDGGGSLETGADLVPYGSKSDVVSGNATKFQNK